MFGSLFSGSWGRDEFMIVDETSHTNQNQYSNSHQHKYKEEKIEEMYDEIDSYIDDSVKYIKEKYNVDINIDMNILWYSDLYEIFTMIEKEREKCNFGLSKGDLKEICKEEGISITYDFDIDDIWDLYKGFDLNKKQNIVNIINKDNTLDIKIDALKKEQDEVYTLIKELKRERDETIS